MGNSISVTAESVVKPMLDPQSASKMPANHSSFKHNMSSSEIPPECPMHQKKDPEPPKPVAYASECPVKHDQKDINPLNMVSVACFI